jgi:hypothetical protein
MNRPSVSHSLMMFKTYRLKEAGLPCSAVTLVDMCDEKCRNVLKVF